MTIGTNRTCISRDDNCVNTMCFPRQLPTPARKRTLCDDLLSPTCVIRVVLLVSYLLVSYFLINFLRRIFSVCHSFRSMCQSRRMKGFERCFKDEDQGTSHRQNLHAAILRPPAKRIQIMLYERHLANLERSLRVLYEPHLRKENLNPLWEILSPFWG